jgi:hypothetical protein
VHLTSKVSKFQGFKVSRLNPETILTRRDMQSEGFKVSRFQSFKVKP